MGTNARRSCANFALKVIYALKELKTLQENADKEEKKLWIKLKCVQRPDEIWVSEEGQMVLPNCLLSQVARYYHGQAHIGRDDMIRLFKVDWFNAKFRQAAEAVCHRCVICQQLNVGKRAVVQAVTLPPIHDPGHNLSAGDWVVIKKHVRKTCLEPRWRGPYQVVLTTAVKCAGLPNWIHASHTKKVVSPQDHEELLLRTPAAAAKRIILPEPEPEQVEPEVDPELVEKGSITPVRDVGAENPEADREINAAEVTRDPCT
ncbi:hypothetical protein NDU88_001050 [Pleurodeles waltl]|uniref:Murine leukemia virus integrase C-terminal domain-containing protein n=1 Tax=Pleurodeles waltl TaxID=8319 RepID=A0AAV7S8Z9_PLEWA|nr:hypothetical protein NDU88_001050 [Pleurodeles waltl]